jgi:hypothetical protein
MTGAGAGHDARVLSAAGGWLRVTAAGSRGSSLSVVAALGLLLLIVALAVTAVLAARRPWRRIRAATGPPPRRGGRHGRASRARAGRSRAGRSAPPPGYPRDLGLEHPSFPGAGHLRAVGSGPLDSDTEPDNRIKVNTAAAIGLSGVPSRLGSDRPDRSGVENTGIPG